MYLFLAAFWAILAIGVWLSPEGAFGALRVDPGLRQLMCGFAILLVGYNLVRWRLTRARRHVDRESLQAPTRPRRHTPEEPPNPDFDFSDPKPGGQDPAGPKAGSG
jgi:hypothetical protein